MAIPDAVSLGISSFDYERCEMSDDVKIELDAVDMKKGQGRRPSITSLANMSR